MSLAGARTGADRKKRLPFKAVKAWKESMEVRRFPIESNELYHLICCIVQCVFIPVQGVFVLSSVCLYCLMCFFYCQMFVCSVKCDCTEVLYTHVFTRVLVVQ